MQRLLVMSDTHLMTDLALNVIRFEKKKALICKIIHLGDGLYDLEEIKEVYKDIAVEGVRGNCDFDSNLMDNRIIEIGDKKIFITHGHTHDVKECLDMLKMETQTFIRRGVEAVLFGHTHKAYIEEENGILFFNPGSVGDFQGKRSYGIIEIDNGKINANIYEIDGKIYNN